MVQRSKRSMDPFRAHEMRKTTLAFQHEIRRWSGEIPLGTTIYVALQALNDSVGLTLQQLSAAVDEGSATPTAGACRSARLRLIS
jgi:hypothetical protein